MSARTAMLHACRYIYSLPACSEPAELGRTLLLMPAHRWVRFLEYVGAKLPAGSPEQEAAVMLLRIVADGVEVAA